MKIQPKDLQKLALDMAREKDPVKRELIRADMIALSEMLFEKEESK